MPATAPNKQRSNGTTGTVQAIPTGAVDLAKHDIDLLRLKLSNNLQSTLILDQAIEMFYTNVKNVLRCDGLRYENAMMNVDLMCGVRETHSAKYSISSQKEQLGDVLVFRKHMFSEPELAVLEMLIGVLFYPLRNTLLYREALQNSLRDGLTGIGNRSALEHSFDREVKLAKRHRNTLSIALIDIDLFKTINDNHGHSAGDAALKSIAKDIQSSLRETDQVFRYGGEEFIAILHEADISNAEKTAERIRKTIATTPIIYDGVELRATCSIGVCTLRESDDPSSFFKRTDKALYKAKNAGRNRVVCESNLGLGEQVSLNKQGVA
ncbi:MAG: diguanylate cyclase (GGDEF)-like protein [Flavobacteriales bacterium]|jgi:diguanylate cyclase (GGDEF)-like protein